MKRYSKYLLPLVLVLLSFAMHFRHLNKDLVSMHVWRQTETQSTIQNFYEEDFNILNPRKNDRGEGSGIFRMEFPLMQWLVAGLYKIFGNHIWISRFFSFLVGLLSVFGIYHLVFSLFQNKKTALATAWAFNFSPCFFYYTINPLPDNFALAASIGGMAVFFYWIRDKSLWKLLISGFLLSIGALCKLPFILYFIVPASYFLFEFSKHKNFSKLLKESFPLLGFAALPLAWYIWVIPQWYNDGIINGIAKNETSFTTILGYLGFNLISTLPELLINLAAVPFFLAGFYFLIKNKSFKNPLFPLLVIWSGAILFYFFYEINMIATVHDYYLFPFYPLIFLLIGYGIQNLLKVPIKNIGTIVIIILLVLPITAQIRMWKRWDTKSPGFNKDLLIYKDDLRKALPDNALCVCGSDDSHFIYFYYIHKKGWAFDHNNLDSSNLSAMISDGAKYLYSDSRIIDTSAALQKYFDSLLLERGSIKVFKLKK